MAFHASQCGLTRVATRSLAVGRGGSAWTERAEDGGDPRLGPGPWPAALARGAAGIGGGDVRSGAPPLPPLALLSLLRPAPRALPLPGPLLSGRTVSNKLLRPQVCPPSPTAGGG